MQTKKFYDDFSSDYDRFVNWPSRLELELPFLEKQLKEANAHHVLDAACGTGMHAIALAKKGFTVSGADLSEKMIEWAKSNAKAAGISMQFKTAGFGKLNSAFGRQSFNAVLCLGNSLPHLLSAKALEKSLIDFAKCLKPGGLLIIQNRNFDAVMKKKQRWMEPQYARKGNSEWLILRFYDFEPDGLLNFNILTLKREGDTPWQQSILSTPLRPILAKELHIMLPALGFQSIEVFGDLTGSTFNAGSSGNLVVVAKSK
jgi:glycine/sarcosine N-methyltransferase